MQYICLTIRYIAKQKRSKKQHLVAPKFAQNLNVSLILAEVSVNAVISYSTIIYLPTPWCGWYRRGGAIYSLKYPVKKPSCDFFIAGL